MSKRMLRKVLISVVLIGVLLLVGCGIPGDPMVDDSYTKNIYPGSTVTYNLGSPIYKWNDGYFHTLHVDVGTLYIGGVPFTSGNVTLPINESDVSNLVSDLGDRELTANKGEVGGYAPLDSGGKIAAAYLGTLPKSGGGLYLRSDQTWATPTASAVWGSITGTLSSQTDLQGALDSKLSAVTGSYPIVSSGGTTPNITLNYDTDTLTVNAGNNLAVDYDTSTMAINAGTLGVKSGVYLASGGTAANSSLLESHNATYFQTAATILTTLSNLANASGVLTNNGSGTLSWGTGGMVYPDVGIALSTGSAWGTSITNNSANWNTAYDYRLTSASGTAPLTLTLASNGLTGSVDLSSKQNAHANLTSLAGLSWASGSPLVKMTAANTFGLDTSTYLTGNQSVTWTASGDVSGSASGATSISPSLTVTGIQGKGITLATGYLNYTGSAWSFNSVMTNPMTTLGDIVYENATPAAARLAGNTTSTKNFLTSTGNGTVAAAPSWGTLASGDIPDISATYETVSNLTNTWAGTSHITTLGTIGTGTWNGGVIAGQYGGTGVANTGKTITLGGNLTTSGAYNLTLNLSNTTSLTLPTVGTLVSYLINQSTASQSGFAADTYLTGSSIAIPSGLLKVGTRYHLIFDVSKTAAGTATPIIYIRFGTNGSTADTARLTFTFLAQTAAADVGQFEVFVTFRTVGSGTSAVIQGSARVCHSLAATGLQNLAGKSLQATSSGFDSTVANSKIGASVNGGTSAAWTVQLVQAELIN